MPVMQPHPAVAARTMPPGFGGSMLGMAHSTQNLPAPQPLPRPVPLNASFDNSGG